MNNKPNGPSSTNGDAREQRADRTKGAIIIGVGVSAGICALVWAYFFSNLEDPALFTVRLWIGGAGALGLVSGFITGFSSSSDSGKAFTTFISTGLLVPILGGVAALLGDTEKVTEKTTYLNSNIVEKTTETVSSISDNLLHPLAVLGSFFLAFGVLAILGIIAAKLLKDGNLTTFLYS